MGASCSSTAPVQPLTVSITISNDKPTAHKLLPRASSSSAEPEPQQLEHEQLPDTTEQETDDTVTQQVSDAAKEGVSSVVRVMKEHESSAAHAAWCCDAIAGLCAGNGAFVE